MTAEAPSKQMLRLARAGDVDAMCWIADDLMSGETSRGYRAALPWLRRGARLGNSWAEYSLGLIYDKGLAGRVDRRRAALWYERSAAQGYSSAQLNLGILLANRRGSARDLGRAVELYRLAARQGRRNAAYNLGLYYMKGRGVPKSVAKARKWFGQAADQGDRDARRLLRELGGTWRAGGKQHRLTSKRK